MKLYELKKGDKVELAPGEIWTFNKMDGMYGQFYKGNEIYSALRRADELEKKNGFYIPKI